jgi:hypothetical protein
MLTMLKRIMALLKAFNHLITLLFLFRAGARVLFIMFVCLALVLQANSLLTFTICESFIDYGDLLDIP